MMSRIGICLGLGFGLGDAQTLEDIRYFPLPRYLSALFTLREQNEVILYLTS